MITLSSAIKQTLLCITICIGLFASSAALAVEYGTFTVSKVISVYDGDTFRVDIDELSPIAGKNIPIRVNGVDTPEIQGKCDSEKELAIEVRDYVAGLLDNADEILLVNTERGKYFRILAVVMIDGVNLAELLIDNGLGYAYEGDTKKSWCE